MTLSIETLARLYAAGRNYINLGLGFATSLGLVSAAQSKTLSESFAEVFAGIGQVAHGLTSIWQILVIVGGPTAGAILAWYAQRSAKTVNQAAAVNAAVKEANGNPKTQLPLQVKATILDAAASLPEARSGEIKVSDPVLATATPANNVVAK